MATKKMKVCKKCMMKRETKRDMKMAKVKSPKGKAKVKKVMEEYKSGELHSGSKKGPRVTNPKQAIAIALSEARRKKKKK
jgi:hypothetical protein